MENVKAVQGCLMSMNIVNVLLLLHTYPSWARHLVAIPGRHPHRRRVSFKLHVPLMLERSSFALCEARPGPEESPHETGRWRPRRIRVSSLSAVDNAVLVDEDLIAIFNNHRVYGAVKEHFTLRPPVDISLLWKIRPQRLCSSKYSGNRFFRKSHGGSS